MEDKQDKITAKAAQDCVFDFVLGKSPAEPLFIGFQRRFRPLNGWGTDGFRERNT